MKKKIIILTLLFLVLVIVFAPVRLAENFIPESNDLSISGMQGSIWSGRIDLLEIKDWALKNIDYDLSVFALLSGTIGGSAKINKGDIKGDLSFGIADQNSIAISDGNIEISALNFERYLPFPGIELNGKFLTNELSAQLVDKKPIIMTGETSWKGASVSIAAKKYELGNFQIIWDTDLEKKLITGTIKKNQKNKLDMDGKINITNNGMFEFNGSIAASSEKAIYSAFSLFANGKVQNGRLPIQFKKKIF